MVVFHSDTGAYIYVYSSAPTGAVTEGIKSSVVGWMSG